MAVLKTKIASMRFDPPVILASGVMGQTSSSMLKMHEYGMGGIVTKSIGLEPRAGHPNPTMVELDTGLLNAMGLPNPGIEDFLPELKSLISKVDIPIIASIFGSNREEFIDLAGKMEANGVDAIELNLSCPHAEGYGASIGSNPDLSGDVVDGVVSVTDVPILAKLPPLSDVSVTAKSVEHEGADAIVAINTVKAMALNFETRLPILGNRYGGYSGPGIKPVGLRCVYELFEAVDIPIIGCGGITRGRDALEYILAGASALQVGSAVYYRGREAAKLISEEMIDLMDEQDIKDIHSLIGAAHRC